MGQELNKLVARYELLRCKIDALIDIQAAGDDERIRTLDGEMSSVFDEIVSIAPVDVGGHIEKIEFLCNCINYYAEDPGIVEKLSGLIMQCNRDFLESRVGIKQKVGT